MKFNYVKILCAILLGAKISNTCITDQKQFLEKLKQDLDIDVTIEDIKKIKGSKVFHDKYQIFKKCINDKEIVKEIL